MTFNEWVDIEWTIDNDPRDFQYRLALRAYNAGVLAGGREAKGVCGWTCDDDGSWWSGCGNTWIFTDGGPVENKMKFCPFCGGVLLEANHDPVLPEM